MSEYKFRRYKGDGKKSAGGRTSALREDKGVYIASPPLATAVNTAIAARRPLLLTGEPGCGKSSLAYGIADELGLGDVLSYTVRSDSQARDVLYKFDHLKRLYHAQNKIPGEDPSDASRYRELVALGAAISSRTERVVLIDEIDKASRDFPNDLLGVIDELDFTIPETGEYVRHDASALPIVIITSNVERQLPEPFLRRCVYHHITFPKAPELVEIVKQRLGTQDLLDQMVKVAVQRFEQLRSQYKDKLAKLPATAELLAWVRVLLRSKTDPTSVAEKELKELYPGALLKTKADLELLAGPL